MSFRVTEAREPTTPPHSNRLMQHEIDTSKHVASLMLGVAVVDADFLEVRASLKRAPCSEQRSCP